MNGQVDSIFQSLPRTTLIVTEAGHAFAKAKFDSLCPLTKMDIRYGESVRKIRVVTRSGATWEGYTANRVFGLLEPLALCDEDVMVSMWSRCSDGWVEDLASSIEGARPGARVRVIEKNGVEKMWHLSHPGQWSRNYRNSKETALLSSLRRGSKNRVWKFEA